MVSVPIPGAGISVSLINNYNTDLFKDTVPVDVSEFSIMINND